MNKFVVYAWCFFIASLTFGIWTIPMVIVAVLLILFLLWKKPDWFK